MGKALRDGYRHRAFLMTKIDVLQLLATGYSTREIARRFNLSIKTVETHRAEIMSRLGIDRLAGLVKYALSVGLVSPTP